VQILTDWFKKYFTDPQIVSLAVVLVIGFTVVLFFGNMLMPVLASIVIAYLLEGLVCRLERIGLSRLMATIIVFSVFMMFVLAIFFGLLPRISRQATELFQQLPSIISKGQKALMQLPERYPEFVSPEQIQELIALIRSELADYGQKILTVSLASVVGLITLSVYLVLMPLLVFFFLKDKDLIIDWFRQYLPKHRKFAGSVWKDVDRQIGNYVRGKFWEIVILWAVSFATFSILGLNFSMLLSVLVGLSVIIPYIGAAVVTIPVLVIAWFQWGWSSDFIWLTGAYFVVQALDGNVLVPLLFSEVVNLHPVAIIVAILVFGGLWGFWGVFFAIPLATLVQAVLTAWPREGHPLEDDDGDPALEKRTA